uniref:Uncharacterized protein n=1 Tax=Anguilla anguilla TaxID=7936 RepID=A0A0E9VQ62_ANGAN
MDRHCWPAISVEKPSAPYRRPRNVTRGRRLCVRSTDRQGPWQHSQALRAALLPQTGRSDQEHAGEVPEGERLHIFPQGPSRGSPT